MPYQCKCAMQPNEGERIEFVSSECEDASDALEDICIKVSEKLGYSPEAAGDFLADMECHGKLDERLYLNGIEVDMADHL